MARKKMILDDVRERVVAVVDQFNEENVKPPDLSPVNKILKRFGAPPQVEISHRYGDYVVRFKGAYLYYTDPQKLDHMLRCIET